MTEKEPKDEDHIAAFERKRAAQKEAAENMQKKRQKGLV